MKITENELELRLTLVNLLTSSIIFNESLDELKETSFYSGNLKKASKQFEIQITNTCNKQINTMWKHDEGAASEITKGIRDIAIHISKLKPSEIIQFAEELKN